MAILNGIQKFLHTLRTTKNVEVGQDLIVDGDGTVGGTLGVAGISTFAAATIFDRGGNTPLMRLRHSGNSYLEVVAYGDDGLHFAIGNVNGAGNRHFIFTDTANSSRDHDHDTLSDNPTIFGHSVRDPDESNTEWWSKTHDGSNAVYALGFGGHVFKTAAQKARGTMTLGGIPVADETFVINATTITFKADGSGDIDHCTIAGNAADQVTNLVATLAECTEAANLTAWDGAGDTVVYEWGTAGVAGNAIVFTEAATNVTVDGAGTLGTTHAGVAAATLFTIAENKAIAMPGVLTVTGSAILNNGVVLASNREVAASAATHGSFVGRSTFQTIDAPFLTTGTVANHLIFCENADWIFDFEHTQQTNPTFYIHSANQSTTEWVGRAHDQTNATYTRGTGIHEFDAAVRASTSVWKNYRQLGATSLGIGATGATFTAPDAAGANATIGGWHLDNNAAAEYLYFEFDVHGDWDGASDVTVNVYFEQESAGGGAGQTTVLDLELYYKQPPETTSKGQSLTASSVTGASGVKAQWMQTFTIDYNPGGGMDVEAGDVFTGRIFWDNVTSTDATHPIVNHVEVVYLTKQPAIEA